MDCLLGDKGAVTVIRWNWSALECRVGLLVRWGLDPCHVRETAPRNMTNSDSGLQRYTFTLRWPSFIFFSWRESSIILSYSFRYRGYLFGCFLWVFGCCFRWVLLRTFRECCCLNWRILWKFRRIMLIDLVAVDVMWWIQRDILFPLFRWLGG
jgi:hypothetical protein